MSNAAPPVAAPTPKLIYVANLAWVDDHTVAWNLSTVGRTGDVAGEAVVPWVFPVFDPAEFQFLWVGKNGQALGTAGVAKQSALGALNDDLRKLALGALEITEGSLRASRLAKLSPLRLPGDKIVNEVEHDSVSGTFAGLSQQGYAVANPLGLTRFLELDPKDAPPDAEYLAVWPRTVDKPWDWGVGAFQKIGGLVGGALLVPEAVELQFNLLNKYAAPDDNELFLEPLVKEIDAGRFTNWRANLSQTLGEYLDLGWWWRSALNGLQESDWQKDFVQPAAGGTRNLRDEIRKKYLLPALSLFHDHADCGLRQSVPERSSSPPSDVALAVRGTVAELLFNALTNAADSDLGDEKISPAQSFLTAWFESMVKLQGFKPEEALRQQERSEKGLEALRVRVFEALREVDASPLDGAYGDLFYWLDPQPEVDPDWSTFKANEWPPHRDRQWEKLRHATEQLTYLLEDDEVLLRLWTWQWESQLEPLPQEDGQMPPPPLPPKRKALALLLGELAARETRPLTNRLNKLRDVLGTSGRSLAQRYGDGLAGEFWKTTIQNLGVTLVDDSKNAEENAAGGYILGVLKAYYAARFGGANMQPMPFLEITSDALLKAKLESAYQQAVVEAPKADYKAIRSRHWKLRTWPRHLIGATENKDDPVSALPVPPPLPVPAVFKNYKIEDHAGLLVFAARPQAGVPAAKDWWALNLGELVIYDESGKTKKPDANLHLPAKLNHESDALIDDVGNTELHVTSLASCAPAPWQLISSHGIEQACLDYRGQPVMVKLWEDYADDPVSNNELRTDGAQTRKVTAHIFREQIVDPSQHNGWGPVPGLRYDKDAVYWFAFAPIANCGALPGLLRHGKEITELLPKEKFNAANVVVPFHLQVRNYTRRVRVGEVRMTSVEKEGLVSNLRLAGVSFPDIPAGVRPMAVDLQKETEAYLKELSSMVSHEDADAPREQSRPQLPSSVILLQEGKNQGPGSVNGSVSFRLRPPATEIENWSIWLASIANDEGGLSDLNQCYDLIADARRYVRELRSGLHGGYTKDEINDLLDDPAVCGVWVRSREIYPADHQEADVPGKYFSFDTVDHYETTPPDRDLLQPLEDQTCQNVHQFVRRLTVEMVKIQWTEAWQAKPQDGATISVGPGQIVQVELIPCVRKKSLERFGIYAANSKDCVVCPVNAQETVYGILTAMTRLWAEAVPSVKTRQEMANFPGYVSDANPSPAEYLPNPEEVWKALRLGTVGEHQGERVQVPRLEVVVKPQGKMHPAAGDMKDCWSFVSEVAAEIQPWIWRGMPEAASAAKGGLWGVVAAQNASDDKITKELLDYGELPSFAEREDASALEVAGLVNVVNVNEQLGNGSVIYQDHGEQEENPRYYRVRLRVYSRYQGLGGGHAIPVHSYKKLNFPAQEQEKQNENVKIPAETRITHHKRIGFRGKLPQRLNLPRVKLVIPLLESSSTTGRPGFLVLTRETLASPFHRLQAAIEWAELNDPTKPEVRQALPEFGPDPLTSGESFDWSFRDQKALQAASILEGKAIGLTYEREASDPLFANAAFYFDVPMADDGKDPAAHVWDKHDLFLKIKFRWAILPQNVMDNPATDLVSEFTNGWQVRLLAPLDHLVTGDSTRQDFSELRCKLVDQSPAFEKKLSGEEWGAFPLQTPKFDPNQQNPDASPAAAFVFVAWSLVPDFLNSEPSKLTHSLYLWDEKKWIQLQRNKTAPAPSGGNFLLLFSRQGDLKTLIEKCGNAAKSNEDSLDHLLEFLFGNAARSKENSIMDEDAKGMLVRCSPVIDILSH